MNDKQLGGLSGAFFDRAAQQLARLFDGSCRIYRLHLQKQAGLCFGAEWREAAAEDFHLAANEVDSGAEQIWPCHLALPQRPQAEWPEDGSEIAGRGRLFLPPDAPEPPPGSRVLVSQQGREFCLLCSGPAVRYPTHMELEARIEPERA